jgi:hypothetical protein
MATLKKLSASFDFIFVKLSADLDESDRQCAWEFFTELATRVAVTGKPKDTACEDFSGEIYVESLTSLYIFFGEARKIMRQFPVGKINASSKIQNHLGALIYRVIRDVLRPFLEKWQAEYRYWWEYTSDKALNPFERQDAYPRRDEMIADWVEVRAVMKTIQIKLIDTYKLVNVVVMK